MWVDKYNGKISNLFVIIIFLKKKILKMNKLLKEDKIQQHTISTDHLPYQSTSNDPNLSQKQQLKRTNSNITQPICSKQSNIDQNQYISKQTQVQLYGINNRFKFLNSFRKFIIDKQNQLLTQIQIICQPTSNQLFQKNNTPSNTKSAEKLKDSVRKCQNSLNDIKQYLIKIISVFIEVEDQNEFQQEKQQYQLEHNKPYSIIDEINTSFNQNIELLKIQVKSKIQMLNILKPTDYYEEWFINTSESQVSQMDVSLRSQKSQASKKTVECQKNNKQLIRSLNQLSKQFNDLQKQRDDLLQMVDSIRGQYDSCHQKLNEKQSIHKQVNNLNIQLNKIRQQLIKVYQDINSMRNQILEVITTQVDEYLENLQMTKYKKNNYQIQNLNIKLQQKTNQFEEQFKLKQEYISKLIIAEDKLKQIQNSNIQSLTSSMQIQLKNKNLKIQTLIKQNKQKQILLQRRQQQINFLRNKINQFGNLEWKIIKEQNQQLKTQKNILQNKLICLKQQNRIKNNIVNCYNSNEKTTEKKLKIMDQVNQLKIENLAYFKQRQKNFNELNYICQQNHKLRQQLKKKQYQIREYQKQVKTLIIQYKREVSKKINYKRQNSEIIQKNGLIQNSQSHFTKNSQLIDQKSPSKANSKLQESCQFQFDSSLSKEQQFRQLMKSICLKANLQVYNIEQKIHKSRNIEKLYAKQLEKKRLQNKELKKQLGIYKKLQLRKIDQENL